MTDEEIRAIVTDYDDACERAMEERDARLRAARDAGRKQAELVRITGYSRETIRQALNPEVRAAVKKAAAERRAARKDTDG